MNETNIVTNGSGTPSDPYTFNFHTTAQSVGPCSPWAFRAEGFLLGLMVAAIVGGALFLTLIGLLAQLRPEPDLRLQKTIAQGIEMGRPSRLDALAEKSAGKVIATHIGGTCVPVMRGAIDLA